MHLTAGIQSAHSLATDAHKWLNVPYDCGIALVSQAEYLRAAMSVRAAYLKIGQSKREPCDWNPELSRRARAIEVWAALRSLGRSGLAQLLERTCRFARFFADGLSQAGYEILNEVVLNQVLVSFGTASLTDRVTDALQQDGTCWCGTTTWQGRKAMRISVSSWATTQQDVDLSLDAMLRIAHECSKESNAAAPLSRKSPEFTRG
jgi:glutamate/tyrosine decarboxylase-like PLP-dependent enzyme